MINIADLVMILIILGFTVFGIVNGFVMSIFRVVSFFVSIFLAITFYPLLADFYMKSPIFNTINSAIFQNLQGQQAAMKTEIVTETAKTASNTMLDGLAIPSFLKNTISSGIPNFDQIVDTNKILEAISFKLTEMIISVLSLIMLFILIKIGLFFIKFLIKGFAKMPVFKQVDRAAGFILGTIEGFLMIYILCALLTLVSTMPQFENIFNQIDNSSYVSFIYNNNYIIEFLFPK